MNLLLGAVLLLQDQALDRLLEELRSDQARVRDHAERELRKIGEDAAAALERTATDKDAEVAARARECLNHIRYDAGTRTLRKIEESAAKAGTLTLKLSTSDVSPKAQASGWALSGTALLKGGDRLFLFAETFSESGRREVTLHCDGSRFALFRGSFGALRGQWGDFRREDTVDLLPGLISGGLWVTARTLAAHPVSLDQASLQPVPPLRLSDFKQEDLGKVGTLAYSIGFDLVRPKDVVHQLRAVLGYDPKTWRPLWRTIQVTLERNKDETFGAREEFEFDADIPDEKFKVPYDSRFK